MSNDQVKISELTHFSAKQKEASDLLKNYKYILYGGAMGGGKSYWLRWELVRLLLRWAKRGHTKVVVGLFCEDYPTLQDRHLSKISKEFPTWLGQSHGNHRDYGRCFILSAEYGSGVILFRNLDDSSKYQSAEFAAVAVDELTKNPRDIFTDLRTRLRWAGIDDVKFIGATNPGGIGHAWVKKEWMDNVHEVGEKEGHLFKYIPAKATDNPHLSPSYMDTLSGLPEDLKKAFIEGDWDIFKGQYFTEWRREIHVCKVFDIPPHWPKFICGDYGYLKPSAIYWCATNEDGQVFIYRELYKTSLTFRTLAEEIITMTPPNEDIRYWVFDPAIWAKGNEKDGEPLKISGAEIMSQAYKEITNKFLNVIRGNNDRVNGWNQFRSLLKPFPKGETITANIQVFPTCHEFIRTFPALVYDSVHVEDVDSDGEDHAADSVRYGIMSRPSKAPNPRSSIRTLGLANNSHNEQTSFE